MTFVELAESSARVAAGLHRLGVRPGDVVTVFLDNRWEWLPAYHGALRAGAVVNPVNASTSTGRIMRRELRALLV